MADAASSTALQRMYSDISDVIIAAVFLRGDLRLPHGFLIASLEHRCPGVIYAVAYLSAFPKRWVPADADGVFACMHTLQVLYSAPCQLVTPRGVVPGALRLTAAHVHFVGDPPPPPEPGAADAAGEQPRKAQHARAHKRWPLAALLELHHARYLLQQTALELFLQDRSDTGHASLHVLSCPGCCHVGLRQPKQCNQCLLHQDQRLAPLHTMLMHHPFTLQVSL